LHLSRSRPTTINYIMGVAVIPRRFDQVRTIHFAGDHIVLESASGATVRHEVDLNFFTPSAR
ncbi:MAG TPA: hypothetical protein VKC60_14750, partial [Opitutaceae bacterium]|nr:hypothetical protein [Opitutaceae bacterium]